MGKVPAGILSGNNLWIGSWSACRRISVVKNRQQYISLFFNAFGHKNIQMNKFFDFKNQKCNFLISFHIRNLKIQAIR